MQLQQQEAGAEEEEGVVAEAGAEAEISSKSTGTLSACVLQALSALVHQPIQVRQHPICAHTREQGVATGFAASTRLLLSSSLQAIYLVIAAS